MGNTATSFFTSPFISTLIVPLLLLLAFVFVRWRSGSANILLDRIWRVVAGKREVEDRSILRHLQEMHDLEAFCFRHGIRVGRLGDARNLVWFADSKRIPMRDFSRAAPWVDVTHPNFVRPPSLMQSVGMYVIFGVLLGLAAVIVSAGESRSAMLTTQGSRVTFLADSDGIRSPASFEISAFGRSLMSTWTVSTSTCKSDPLALVRAAAFTESESKAICSSMLDGSLSNQISKSVAFQRQAAGVAALVVMTCASMLLLHVLRGVNARRLLKRIVDAQAN
ncbi:DUF6216 family protein [Pandoraea communis]|uniref:DUF6216 family protein n=1 Tax=Pandoraea communis TaxID=2508297 RepID=UPI003570A2F0